ncbi:MAG TPA: 50S ribosomal protein L37e [Candidatus Nanoarchaeia archaeon]|nr:50S ribosomal protein L37e [Candidatus Nanoarchaeia archaeon]
MSKGTASMGRKSGKKTHIRCRRCGGHTFHVRKKKCASCGYGSTATLRKYNWNKKTHKN